MRDGKWVKVFELYIQLRGIHLLFLEEVVYVKAISNRNQLVINVISSLSSQELD